MNVFCQTETVLPQNGDIPVWNAKTCRWEFRAGDVTPPEPSDPTDPEDPENPKEPVKNHEIGEWKEWYQAAPPQGWKVRNGELLTGVSMNFPELLAYLKLPENTWMLKNELEWQALSQTHGGGIGGVWHYSLDEEADTIRLPDTRGDFVRDSGGMKGEAIEDGVYAVGEWHGDAIRNIEGAPNFSENSTANYIGLVSQTPHGPYRSEPSTKVSALNIVAGCPSSTGSNISVFDASRVVPTANENRPRAGMLLGCVFVGR